MTNSQTGEPVKKVQLQLVRGEARAAVAAMHMSGLQGYSATSEADGSFRIEGIEPGTYTLSGQRTGYLAANYGAAGPRSSGKTLTLAPAQQLTNISLPMTRESVISGKVLDEDGDPAPDIGVQALTSQWMGGKLRHVTTGTSTTNDLGEFRIGHLNPGKYYVVAEEQGWMRGQVQGAAAPGKPDVRPVRTFYPDAVTRATATPIEVRAGQDVPGMDIRLHTAATYHVRGKIAGVLPEGELERIHVLLTTRDDETTGFFFQANSNVDKDLKFDIAGVAPGAYTLTMFKLGGPARTLGRQSIDVGTADLNDLVLKIIPPVTLHGQIRFEGTPPADSSKVSFINIRVSLSPIELGIMFSGPDNTAAKADGSFTLENILPARYYVHTQGTPGGTYLKSIRLGQEDIYQKELDLTYGSSGELEMLFRYGPADIEGTVVKPGDADASANTQSQMQIPATASIILVPDVLPPDGTGMRQGAADQNGAFSMKQVPPGHYRIYAFEQVESEQLDNPDVLKELRARGVELELNENDKKQIQLPLISAEDLQQTLARLGIEP